MLELAVVSKRKFKFSGHMKTVEKERNRMSIDSVRGILLIKYNLKKLSCIDFHAYVSANNELLRKGASSDKYETSS